MCCVFVHCYRTFYVNCVKVPNVSGKCYPVSGVKIMILELTFKRMQKFYLMSRTTAFPQISFMLNPPSMKFLMWWLLLITSDKCLSEDSDRHGEWNRPGICLLHLKKPCGCWSSIWFLKLKEFCVLVCDIYWYWWLNVTLDGVSCQL